MKQTTDVCVFIGILVISLTAVTGCATRAAPDIKGRWQAVNRYSATAQEIPLHQPHVFYPAPLDGTLKSMLTRWARDSKMTMSYLHHSDFTLHAPVAEVRTANLQEAVSLLNTAYADQRVLITVSQNQIIVRSTADASAGP